MSCGPYVVKNILWRATQTRAFISQETCWWQGGRGLLTDLDFGAKVLPFRQFHRAIDLLNRAGHFLGLKRAELGSGEGEAAQGRLPDACIGGVQRDVNRRVG